MNVQMRIHHFSIYGLESKRYKSTSTVIDREMGEGEERFHTSNILCLRLKLTLLVPGA